MENTKECITHHFACDCRELEFKKLKVQNEKLKDALEFYSATSLQNALIGMPIGALLIKEFYNNGELARRTLKEVEG